MVNGTTTTNKYGFTGTGDSPDLLLDSSNNVVERYIQLPGGVLYTKRSSTTVFSLPNVHGDVMATTDASGAQTGTFTYDPFGNPVSSSPDNTATSSTYGWVGQHEKDTETAFALAPTEMGARVYLASIGRFLQVDPVEGGTPNNYVYALDPVNEFDLDGTALTWGGLGRWAWQNKYDIALTALVFVPGIGEAALVGRAVGVGVDAYRAARVLRATGTLAASATRGKNAELFAEAVAKARHPLSRVETQVIHYTPAIRRVDVQVTSRITGRVSAIEVKAGRSAYTAAQRAKDAILRGGGIRTRLWRFKWL
jgi:RHS repeat-associated protein